MLATLKQTSYKTNFIIAAILGLITLNPLAAVVLFAFDTTYDLYAEKALGNLSGLLLARGQDPDQTENMITLVSGSGAIGTLLVLLFAMCFSIPLMVAVVLYGISRILLLQAAINHARSPKKA